MSSRIADIIVEAKLETRQFMTGLRNMRVNIIANFETLRAFANPVKAIEDAVEDVAGTVIATGRDIERNVQAQTQAADEMVKQIQEQVPAQRTVQKAAETSAKKTTSAFEEMKKEADEMMTQMRWVARDVMRIGITAGIMGALFVRQIKQIGNATMGMLGIFDDMKWILEDIYWIIGEQMAPIFEALVPPMEMIRDFLESHDAIAKVLAVVLILAAAFFLLSGIILGTVGMYAIMLFGMAQFTKAIEKSKATMQETGGLFGTLAAFLKSIGGQAIRAALGIQDFTNKVGFMTDKSRDNDKTVESFKKQMTGLDWVVKNSAAGIGDVVWELEQLQEKGTITEGGLKSLKKHYVGQYGALDRLKYHFSSVKDSVMGLRGNLGKVRGGLGKVGGAVLAAGKAAGKAGLAMAQMLVMFVVIQPVLSAIEPILEAFGVAMEWVVEKFQPLIDAVTKLLEEHPNLTKAILATAIALVILQAAASPLLLVAMAIAVVILLLYYLFKKLIEIATGKSLDASLNILTTAFKVLFFPVYAIFKLFKSGKGILQKASSGLKGMADKVRGLGAWLWNIVPQPIKDLAKTILNVFPNPLEILTNLWNIFKGIWDILTGDWKGGLTKIGTAVKDIIAEFFKIPIAIWKIGLTLLVKLWEGIKASVSWLKQKIIGGSLVWDIVGWIAMIPLELLKIGADFLVKLWKGLIGGFLDLKRKIFGGSLVWDIIDFFLIIPLELLKIGGNMLDKLWKGIKDLFDGDFTTNIKALPGKIVGFFLGLPGKMFDKGKEIIEKLVEGAKKIIAGIFGEDSVLGKFLISITDFFGDIVTMALNAGEALIEAFVQGITNKEGLLSGVMNALFGVNIADLMPNSPAKKGPLKDLQKWGANIPKELGIGMGKGFSASGIMNTLGNMGPPVAQGGGRPTNITFHNEFVIYATIQDKQDLMTLRDEVSSKQLEEARRMRVLGGGL